MGTRRYLSRIARAQRLGVGGSRRDRPSRVARDERAAGAAAAIGGVVAIVSVLGGVRLAARLLTRRTGGIEPMFPSL